MSLPEIKNTKGLVLTAMLFSVAIILAIVEGFIPPLFPAVPGVKFGLSNIAVMYSLFFIGKKSAFATAFLKALLVFATKGMVAGILSLIGGVLSLTVMTLLIVVFKKNISYTVVSIFGAIFHNIGQIIGIWVIYSGLFLWSYAPFLIAAGAAAGIVTASLLRLVLPALEKIGGELTR